MGGLGGTICTAFHFFNSKTGDCIVVPDAIFGVWFFAVRYLHFPFHLVSSCPLCFVLLLRAAQTRQTCASALCKVALRLPNPVCFDAYCFLKGLADAADVFPLVAPRGGSVGTGRGTGVVGGGDGGGLLESYRKEQEEFSERIEAGEFLLLLL